MAVSARPVQARLCQSLRGTASRVRTRLVTSRRVGAVAAAPVSARPVKSREGQSVRGSHVGAGPSQRRQLRRGGARSGSGGSRLRKSRPVTSWPVPARQSWLGGSVPEWHRVLTPRPACKGPSWCGSPVADPLRMSWKGALVGEAQRPAWQSSRGWSCHGASRPVAARIRELSFYEANIVGAIQWK
jgi:hypothetical protein